MLKSNKIKLTTLLCYLFALNFTIFSFQLGDGTDKSTLQFIKVFDKAKEVHSDSFTTFVIREDNTLWGTGFQLFKKFGVEGDEIVRSFVKLADDVKFFNGSHLIKTDNTLWQVNNGIKKLMKEIVHNSNLHQHVTKDFLLEEIKRKAKWQESIRFIESDLLS